MALNVDGKVYFWGQLMQENSVDLNQN